MSLTEDEEPQDQPLAIQRRPGAPDRIFTGAALVTSAEGEVLFSVGSPDRIFAMRSVTKPLRALALIRERVFEPGVHLFDELAMASGSHSGTQMHLESLAAMAARNKVDLEDLRCPPRRPLGHDAQDGLTRSGGALTSLHSDCSGEHIAALALCSRLGTDPAGYLDRAHPAQQSYEYYIAQALGIPDCSSVHVGRDGCGMPSYAVSMRQVAQAYAGLERHPVHGGAGLIVADAIRNRATLYAGHNRYITSVIRMSEGRILGKCGSDGVYVLWWAQEGVSAVVKVADGFHGAAQPVFPRLAAETGLYFPSPAPPFFTSRTEVLQDVGCAF
ncbi:asparaginase [Amycolatopsis sp. NPDC051758]|uniref:asparaginase n=1 Tax=Amycolatopsis sp. NPDC051758 TaxID=3363935 RepID=UPI0037BBB691